MEIIRLVESSALSASQTLRKSGVSSSTYYRWKYHWKTYGMPGLADNKPYRHIQMISIIDAGMLC